MRLRVGRVDLVGTSRSVKMEDGLNVILGDFTTGKTSFMRLLRVFLGSDFDGIIPELQRVSHLSGELTIGDHDYSVVRRLAQSDSARVDVASGDCAEQLPAMHASSKSKSYGDWLIEHLDLPRLVIPAAPTRPAESGTQPVSVADYLRYCRLTQKEIVADVLGSSQWFKDYKRRVVFGIYFGTYDEQIAKLQEDLRGVESEIRGLRNGTAAFDRFLEGTVLSNRAALESQLAQARQRVDVLTAERTQAAEPADQHLPRAQELRGGPIALRERIGEGTGKQLERRIMGMRQRPGADLETRTVFTVMRDTAARSRALAADAMRTNSPNSSAHSTTRSWTNRHRPHLSRQALRLRPRSLQARSRLCPMQRHRADTRLLGQDRPLPPQPRRRPPSQQRDPHDRDHPRQTPTRDTRLPRTPHPRRQDQTRSPARALKRHISRDLFKRLSVVPLTS